MTFYESHKAEPVQTIPTFGRAGSARALSGDRQRACAAFELRPKGRAKGRLAPDTLALPGRFALGVARLRFAIFQ